jgi:ABC-type uncharacterized transport system permease subunit
VTTYRGATFAGVVTNTIFGFILAYVLLAVFRSRSTVGSFDAKDAVTFVFVTQGLLMVVGIFGNLEMAERIRTGDVAVDLCRPYEFKAWWIAAQFFAGTYIPLVFFPTWLEPIARATPFASMIQLPVEVFLGKHTGLDGLGVFAIQLAWLAVLVVIGHVLLLRATRRLVIQGG